MKNNFCYFPITLFRWGIVRVIVPILANQIGNTFPSQPIRLVHTNMLKIARYKYKAQQNGHLHFRAKNLRFGSILWAEISRP